MRDPERITKILYLLAELWKDVPDWRLGQIISNAVCLYEDRDIFYVEDEELIEKLKLLRDNIRNAGWEHKS